MNCYKYKIEYYNDDEVSPVPGVGVVFGESYEDAIRNLKDYFCSQECAIESIQISWLTDAPVIEVENSTILQNFCDNICAY